MKEIKVRLVGKVLVFVFLAGFLILASRDLYNSFSRAKSVDKRLVESLQPSLNVNLIKKAVGTLKDK